MLLQAGYADAPVTRPRAAAPLATAAPAPENRTRPADDAAITAGVADALRKSRDIAPPNAQVETYDGVTTVRGTGIRVETREGVVTLHGVVEHATVVARAEAIARSVGGVKGVDNKLIASSIFEHDYARARRRFATSAPASAVQPVWCDAPSPSPVSPSKYS